MTSVSPPTQLPAGIRALLSGLRWRIRAYVWIEGITLLVIWLGIVFWIGLAVDYGPVLLGFDEMTLAERGVLLAVAGLVSAVILYRWVLRRAFARLADHSMAVLLERQFGQFHDSLLTVVEMSEHPEHAVEFNQEMLSHTGGEATARLDTVQPRKVFNFFPLWRNVVGALVTTGSVVAFGLLAGDALAIWVNRLGLSDQPWPRRARIEVVGVEVSHTGRLADASAAAPLIRFVERTVTVAKGSSPKLIVRADANREEVPSYCTFRYWTDEGYSSRVRMQRSGGASEGYQRFVYGQKPLKGILSAIHFDVIGSDHRVRDYHIEVVDSPTVVSVALDCQRPAYTELLPQTIDLAPGTQLPVGTRISMTVQSNKQLKVVHIYDPATQQTATMAVGGPDRTKFSYPIERLDADLALEVSLYDTDGVMSEAPHRIAIGAIQDTAPNVQVQLRGIGTAVTPDARVPARGTITDDFGVAEAWFDLHVGDAAPRKYPVELGSEGKAGGSLDFREQRRREQGKLDLKPGQKLVLAVMASDKYDLEPTPNVGSSERYRLDVVTPEDLLARLEARELAQRRRFEHVVEEMTQARDSLLRVRRQDGASFDGSGGAEPEDSIQKDDGKNSDAHAEPGDESAAEQVCSLHQLLVQRAILQTEKSAQEMYGVAVAFDDIREELINNRVDTQERKTRLKEQIADPLKHISKTMCPELEQRLKRLEAKLEQRLKRLKAKLDAPERDAAADSAVVQAEQGLIEAAADGAVVQAEEILIEMEGVLSRMLDLETFNEVVDIVRDLIKTQEEVMEDTKKQRKKHALQGLTN